ncbi:MAG: UDP-N-acetylmuramoyl-L-alanine--D-glutamate ligase [Treponemataceae bacterium]|nr:UDP-N-acetylmuramoyl-L-alanine--D-glutamate ligase [Treponemataceae bacterium]
MGLGLNGGGVEAARYLAQKGALVTVTDLRDEKTLAPSIEQLGSLPIRYVLGHHDMEDFRGADMVIKNPAVKPDSPYLAAARRIETDISLFLMQSPAILCAVTGSKGKSSTASALHFCLSRLSPAGSYLGGNITVSPLTFVDELGPSQYTVLELSSWQLGDLRPAGSHIPQQILKSHPAGGLDRQGRPRALLKPRVSIITTILPDHLDRYGTMENYVSDKRLIYAGQDEEDATVVRYDQWGTQFVAETRGRPFILLPQREKSREKPPFSAQKKDDLLPQSPKGGPIVHGYLPDPEGPGFVVLADGQMLEVVPAHLKVVGNHQKENLLMVALALVDLGFSAEAIYQAIGDFPGIEHRLEFFHEAGGVRFYNDTAATIPEAAAAAIRAFPTPPIVLTGGTDKALDFTPLAQACSEAKAVFLLDGTGTIKLRALLEGAGIAYRGPYDNLDQAVEDILKVAQPGDSVVLSPGCASFGMFLNEFDRGRRWKETVRRLAH